MPNERQTSLDARGSFLQAPRLSELLTVVTTATLGYSNITASRTASGHIRIVVLVAKEIGGL